MKKNVNTNENINKGTFAISTKNKKNIRSVSIGDVLAHREFVGKMNFRIFVAVFIIAFLMKATIGILQVPINAETVVPVTMSVDSGDYLRQTQNSSYYAWRGKVTLTGGILPELITTETITGYLDESLTPVFSINKSQMTLSADKLNFNAIIDTTLFLRGYHKLRIYDGTVTTFTDSEPLWEAPVYFETLPFASIVNVNTTCNMRPTATTATNTIVTTLGPGVILEVLGEEKGERSNTYNTDIWYKVRYTNSNGTVFNGYVISYFVCVLYIPAIKISAAGAVIESFDPNKTLYTVNVPFSTSTVLISDIVRYNKEDTIKLYLNSVEVLPPFSNLLLKTGDNKIEIVYQRGTGTTAIIRKYTYEIWRIAESTEAEFQAQLTKFPESYKLPLRALHTKYPRWIFKPFIATDAKGVKLNWADVIANEDVGTTSLIYKNLPREYYKYVKTNVSATASFSEFINETARDGTSFYTASRAAVEYYVDPRNFIDEKGIFQFELLTYQPLMHTLEGIKKIIGGSGLSGKEAMFLKAGVQSNVSPYHLASRSRQEVSTGSTAGSLSIIAKGTYTGYNNKYLGIYNFYNIGTGSSTDANVLISRGLEFALGNYSNGTPRPADQRTKYIMPWNTEEKAIIGGGIYIGETYINVGQDTLYLQKFDVDLTGGLYSHQYMQNIQAPLHESSGEYNAYSQIGSLSNSFIFKIPVYQNMPELKSPKPEDSNRLSTLTVTGYSFATAFDSAKAGPYEVSVPYTTDKVTLAATTLNSKAVIAGTGIKTINLGVNTFVVSCTPTSGEKREYTIKVTRVPPEESTDNRLKALAITGISFLPSFIDTNTGPYKATVSYSTEKATITAATQSSLARLSGAGEKTLNYGLNDYSVTVTAENGSTKTYRIQITREFPSLVTTKYSIIDGTIKGIPLMTTVGGIKSDLSTATLTLKIFNSLGQEIANTAIIGTGLTVKVYYQTQEISKYTTAVFGDLNGDGKINSTDIVLLRANILRIKALDTKYLYASDINGDKKINSTDIVLIRAHILKIRMIIQK